MILVFYCVVFLLYFFFFFVCFFFFSSRRRHTRYIGDWSSDVCSSDLAREADARPAYALVVDRDSRPSAVCAAGVHVACVGRRSEERRVGKECRSRWSP